MVDERLEDQGPVDMQAFQRIRPLLHFIRSGEVPPDLDEKSFKDMKSALSKLGNLQVYKKDLEKLHTEWMRSSVTGAISDQDQLELKALKDLDETARRHALQTRQFANVGVYRALGGDVEVNPLLAAKWIADEFASGNLDELDPHNKQLLFWLKRNALEMAELVDQFSKEMRTLISRYRSMSMAENAGVKRMEMLAQDYAEARDTFYSFVSGSPRGTRSFTPMKARQLANEFWESASGQKDPGVDRRIMAVLEPLLPQSVQANTDLLDFLESNYEMTTNATFHSDEERHPMLQRPESLLVLYVLMRDREGLIERWRQLLPLKHLEAIANAFGETVMDEE